MKWNEGVSAKKIIIMNYKLEKFWNYYFHLGSQQVANMNYKLEKFWNPNILKYLSLLSPMNYKLEKFWNQWEIITELL